MKLGTALVAIALAACSRAPVVIDGSSPQNFTRTAEEARRDLPVKERLAFDRALRFPPGKRLADTEAEAAEIARRTYDGMTALEVVNITGQR